MMNPVHTLATTLMHTVTNGRATRDNHPGQDRTNAGNGLVLGISGLLHYSVGIWPSRDNVWTNGSVSDHGGPEPMVETQTLMAFLAGGPYGPSDCAGCGNRSLILRSCREDGVLLRADKPITMLDSAFTAIPFEGPPCNGSGRAWFDLTCEVVNVWSTHSDITVTSSEESVRYGYVLGLELNVAYKITLEEIQATMVTTGWQSSLQEYRVWEYWAGLKPGPDLTTAACDAAHPFYVPAGNANTNRAVIVSSYYIFAPVLSNGWSYLGESGKLVVAAARRVRWIDDSGSNLAVCVTLSPHETLTTFVRSPNATIHLVQCSSPRVDDQSGETMTTTLAVDIDVSMGISCTLGRRCTCQLGCESFSFFATL